jgi:hypothetical protein
MRTAGFLPSGEVVQMDVFLGLMMAGLGLITAFWVNYRWESVKNNPKPRLLCTLLTPTGARVFYTLLGSFLAVFGILIAIGVIRR